MDSDLRPRLESSLRVAIKDHDRVAVSALRSALGAIDNAPAVDIAGPVRIDESTIAGSPSGVGAGD